MKENKEIGIDVVQLFKILWKKKLAIITNCGCDSVTCIWLE